jgi:hypothetical protein
VPNRRLALSIAEGLARREVLRAVVRRLASHERRNASTALSTRNTRRCAKLRLGTLRKPLNLMAVTQARGSQISRSLSLSKGREREIGQLLARILLNFQ